MNKSTINDTKYKWDKNRKVILVFSIILLLVIALNYYNNDLNNYNEHAINFKNEYEYYNNKKHDSNKKYLSVSIKEDNVIKYTTYDEIFEILKSSTGVFLFANAKNPASRNIVPILLESSVEHNLDTIYYLDLYSDREILSLDDNNNVIVQKKGTKNYKKLVNLLNDYLTDYDLFTNDGILIPSSKKKIAIPSVLFVKNGNILGIINGCNVDKDNYYDELTDREKDDLLTTYNNYMDQIIL